MVGKCTGGLLFHVWWIGPLQVKRNDLTIVWHGFFSRLGEAREFELRCFCVGNLGSIAKGIGKGVVELILGGCVVGEGVHPDACFVERVVVFAGEVCGHLLQNFGSEFSGEGTGFGEVIGFERRWDGVFKERGKFVVVVCVVWFVGLVHLLVLHGEGRVECGCSDGGAIEYGCAGWRGG